MCIGAPGKVIEIDSEMTAIVEFWGHRHAVRLHLLEEKVEPGDYIVDHAGTAVRRIADDEIFATLAMYETILPETGEDPFLCAAG
jgi:hydrogenase expression/formation protein HypC